MYIKVQHQLNKNIIIGTILHFLFNREDDFIITKENILGMAEAYLKCKGTFGINQDVEKYKKLENFSIKNSQAKALARTYFHELFDDEPQSITFILSI